MTCVKETKFSKIVKEKVMHKLVWSHLKGMVSSSFQNGFGPQAVVVLLTESLNPISTYGNTSCIRASIVLCIIIICILADTIANIISLSLFLLTS